MHTKKTETGSVGGQLSRAAGNPRPASPRGLLIPHMWHYLSRVDLGDFMRVGQLLRLVILGRKRGTEGGWGGGGAETVKVRGSPSVLDCAATSWAISHMCLGLSALGRQGRERKSVTLSLCL